MGKVKTIYSITELKLGKYYKLIDLHSMDCFYNDPTIRSTIFKRFKKGSSALRSVTGPDRTVSFVWGFTVEEVDYCPKENIQTYSLTF